MSALQTREPVGGEVAPSTWMDRMFDEWIKAFPQVRTFGLPWPGPVEELIRVDEFQDGAVRVIRADLPGVDPARDVEITVAHGLLHINARRREERDVDEKDLRRHEIRYGSLTRTLPLPPGATEADIAATYRDGILEIRVPLTRPAGTAAPTTVPVTKG